jgi:hypothetical protein
VRVKPRDPETYDPSVLPEWARETIAQIAREHPENLAHHLDQVAEIEAAGRRAAENSPPPPDNPRDLLHLSAIQTWQALAGGRPAPDLDPADLEQAIYEAFVTSDSWHPVDQLCERWLDLGRQCGLAVDDEQGDLPRTDVLDAISHTISAAIWFGLTTGYLTLTGRYTIPRKFLTHCHAALLRLEPFARPACR